jgi:Lamin Tail Domain
LSVFLFALAAFATSPIVISEFRSRGPAGATDEIVELLNVSSTNINISGLRLKGSSSTGITFSIATNPPVVLAPGEHFLLVGPGYTGTVPPNQIYSFTISDNGGVAITTSNDVVMDAVGLNSAGFHEGVPLGFIPAVNTNRSFMRKAGGFQDTDDNASDFELITPSDPQNHPIIVRFDSISKLPNGHIQLQCSGAPLQSYRLLSTTNIANAFTPIATNSAAGDGTFQFEDSDSEQLSRFYRLASP